MWPGLVSISFRQLSPAEIIALAKENDLRGIEWGSDVHVPPGELMYAQEIGAATRAAGLEVTAYGSYFRFSACDPEAAKKPDVPMERIIETAHALGAPAVRVWAGWRNPGVTPSSVFDAIVAETRRLAHLAEAANLRIDLEFHEDTLAETGESTLRFLQAVDHPAVQTLWQPPMQTPPAARLASLEAVLPYVSNIHCNYFGQNPWPQQLALAAGEAEWKPYLTTLAQTKQARWILLEHVKDHAPANLAADAATLHRWLQDL